MRISKFICLTVILVSFAGSARADDAAIAPFVNDQTIAVVRVDVTHVDSAQSLAWIVDKVKQDQNEAANASAIEGVWTPRIQRSQKLLSGLKQAGAKRLYWVLSLQDISHVKEFVYFWSASSDKGKWIVPIEDGVIAEVIAKLLTAEPQKRGAPVLQARHVGSVVVAGKTLQESVPGASQLSGDWQKALTSEAAIVVGSVPGMALRQSFEENIPTIPTGSGSTPITQLTRGILWISVSIGTPPNPSVSAVAQCTDAAAARGAATTINQLMHQIPGNHFKLFDQFEPIENAAEIFQFKADGSQVRWSPDMNAVVLPLAVKQLSTSLAVNSKNNMRQLLLGMIMYANTHKKFPPDFATLMKEQEMSPGVLQDLQNPTDKEGFIYVKPLFAMPSSPKLNADTAVLYQKWTGGRLVAFADGHIETFNTRDEVLEHFKPVAK